MKERWLNVNRRPAILAIVGASIILVIGLVLAVHGSSFVTSAWRAWAILASTAIIVLATLAIILFALDWWRARIGYADESIVVNLRVGRPYRIPIEHVECFFLGQGPNRLAIQPIARSETLNVVIRLSERAVQWKSRKVNPILGQWSNGYITIRGAWSEPLSLELVNRLNHRLAEIRRKRRAATARITS